MAGSSYKAKTVNSLATIQCECGKQILLIPDVKAMAQAIRNHASEHKDVQKDRQKAKSEANRIEDLLTTQVLEKISKS